MAALLGYHLQVLPEVCVGGAAVLKLLQVGLETEQETGVKRERSPAQGGAAVLTRRPAEKASSVMKSDSILRTAAPFHRNRGA